MASEGAQLDQREQAQEQAQLKKEIAAALYGKDAENIQHDIDVEEKYWLEHRGEISEKIKNNPALKANVERYIALSKPTENFRRRLEVALHAMNKKNQAVSARMAFLGDMKASVQQNPPLQKDTPATGEKNTSTSAPKEIKEANALEAFGKVFGKALEESTGDEAVKKYAAELAKKPDWRNVFLEELFGTGETDEAKANAEKGFGLLFLTKASALLRKPELAANSEMKSFLEAFQQSTKELEKGVDTFQKDLFPNEESIRAFAKELWKTPAPDLCKRIVDSEDFRLKFLVPTLGGGIPFHAFLADEEDFDPKLFNAKIKEFMDQFPKYVQSLKPKRELNFIQEMLNKAGVKDLEKSFKAKFPDVKDVHNFGWPFFRIDSPEEKKKELVAFIDDLMKQPDWQKKIIESKDEEFLKTLDSLHYGTSDDIKIPLELRIFLNEWKDLKAKIKQRAAEHILTLFPNRLGSVKDFMKEVQQMPQEKLHSTLHDSAEFRYKFFTAVHAAKAGKTASVLAGVKSPDFFKNFTTETLLAEKDEQSFAPNSKELLQFIEAETKAWQQKYPQLQNADFRNLASAYSGEAANLFGSYLGTSYGEQQNSIKIKEILADKAHFREKIAVEDPVTADKINKMDDEMLGKFVDVLKFINDLFPQGMSDAVAFAKNLKTLPKDQLVKSFKEDQTFSAKVCMVCEIEKIIVQESEEHRSSKLLSEESKNFLGKDLKTFSKFFNGITEYVDTTIQPLKRNLKEDLLKLWGGDKLMKEMNDIQNKKADNESDAAMLELVKGFMPFMAEGLGGALIRENVDSMLKRFPADSQFQQMIAEADKLPDAVPSSANYLADQKMDNMIHSLQKPSTTQKPNTIQKAAATPAKPEQHRPGLITAEMAANMSMGELMANFIKVIMEFSEKFGVMKGEFKKLGGELTKMTQKNGFSKEELEGRKMDLSRENEKAFAGDKSAEYIATVLGLGPSKHTENSETFLHAFQVSGMVLEQDWGKKNNVQVGDLLFFGKENAEKKKVSSLTAIICETQPRLKMKTVPAEGGKPVIMTVEESEFFKRGELIGFLHFPPQPAPQTKTEEVPALQTDKSTENSPKPAEALKPTEDSKTPATGSASQSKPAAESSKPVPPAQENELPTGPA